MGWIKLHLRGPMPVACAGFALLGLAIAVNALFLQSGQHPAPLLVTRAYRDAPRLPARDPLVEALQTRLKGKGVYDGPVDGVLGPQTKAAVASLQRSFGRAATGAPTPDLLDLLRDKASTQTAAAPAATGAPAGGQDTSRVAAVQDALSRAAYGQLRADGVFGPQTEQAIRRFQQDHGLPSTGEVDDALIVELRAAGAMAEK